MSVFSGEGQSGLGQTMMENCKRDYETEIADKKQEQDVTLDLGRAIENYLTVFPYYSREKEFTMPSLYGLLTLEERDIQRHITRLQSEWEKEK